MEPVSDTSLHETCFYGSEREIISLLDAGEDVNRYNEDGFTPLHIAVQRPDHLACSVTNLLVGRGADVNAITLGEGETCLHLLARLIETRQAADVALTLLLLKADSSLRDRKLRTAYDYAISKDKGALADIICPDVRANSRPDTADLEDMKKNASAANLGDKLTRAVITGNKEDTNAYIQSGANPDFINENGAGAIHYAVTHCPTDRIDFITILLEGGADVNLRDHEDDTALNLAIKMHKSRPMEETEAIVNKLLHLGANKAIKDIDGRDAADVAKQRKLLNILELLSPPTSPVRQESPVKTETPNPPKTPAKTKTPSPPKTPAKTKTPSPPETPVKHKTPIPPTPAPKTPVLEDTIDEIENVRPWGKDPNIRNDEGRCPIHEILEDKSFNEDKIISLLPLLIEDGADVDATVTTSGDTALHMATSRGMVNVVRKLLDLGANESIENKLVKMPYDVSIDNGFDEIAEVLKNRMVVRGKWQKATKKAKNCVIL
ncbi:unnamed protein product [Owenia fusiformis]|uniref:Uncharacterized protein n=1 Tax=Owenia fusiformis TaxID=6347 RepID=A0A8S4NT08_OWEFU|nr:unnamed protein product [Owenia fusiformis]